MICAKFAKSAKSNSLCKIRKISVTMSAKFAKKMRSLQKNAKFAKLHKKLAKLCEI
jgi:hypothetical protein